MGTLYLVSTPIGNLADITTRAIEVLRTSDVILAEDTRRTRILLDHCGVTPLDLRSYHQHNEASRTEEVLSLLEGGATVALVTDSGTPLVSDPGLRLVQSAIEAGASIVPIPGPSAALAALVASGLATDSFTFVGFLPRSGRERAESIEELETMPRTAVIFESPQRLLKTLQALSDALGEERRVVVARELTKIHEEFVRGTLSEALAYYKQNPPRGEVVLCLAAASHRRGGESADHARHLAVELARAGSTAKDIVRALRERYGLERNRAYELALEAADEEAES